MIAIATRHLTRRFGDVEAVTNLDLEIGAGEVVGILGHNGAGKTTTVRLLNGLLTPDAGSIEVLGYDPVRNGMELRRRTGVLTETPSLDERLSGRQNLTLYADIYGLPRAAVATRVEALLDEFGLADRADDRAGDYSKGMKQRLALARTLLHEPELLFLDEPTAGLDPIASRQVHDLIRSLSEDEGRTVVLLTHNLIEAQALCQRVAVLQQGRLIALGTPAELAEAHGRHLQLRLQVAPAQRGAAQALLVEHDPTLDGDDLVLDAFPRPDIPALVRRLAEAGIDLYALVPEPPSLEQIYFALHREGDAAPPRASPRVEQADGDGP